MPKEGRRFRVVSSKKQRKTDQSVKFIFPANDYDAILRSFQAQQERGYEGYGIVQCGTKADPGKKTVTYMVKSLHLPAAGDLIEHSSVSVTPSAEFMEAILSDAADRGSTVLEIHTHPGSRAPTFSSVDLDHGLDNGRFLKSCRIRFSMMVLGADCFSVLEYDSDSDALQMPDSAAITVISRAGFGHVMSQKGQLEARPLSATVDRQVRLWGESCQRKIGAATAGVAGLGGTGSALLQMLARLGVRRFVLCDPDVVEESNLSRLPYAFACDVGKKKTRAAAGYLKKVSQEMEIEAIHGTAQDAASQLKGCDMLFGCVDNDGARLSLNEIALKYFIPYIDTGTEIFTEDGAVTDIGGQVRVIVPSVTGCLECAGAIDKEEAAAHRLSGEVAASRAAAGYASGAGTTPAPAVITLNTIVASMAVQAFVDMMAGQESASKPNYLIYDAARPCIRQLSFERSESCPMCGHGGILGAGDLKRQIRGRVKALRSPR